MIEICPKESCTGCAACMGACHKDAITMTVDLNRLGHLYPVINPELCVDCGACKKKCPQVNEIQLHKPEQAFATWALDQHVHMKSTSGGLAFTIAYEFMDKWNGVVYACVAAYEAELSIKHVRIEDKGELHRIQGSKYVQSEINGILFKQIRNDLRSNRKVLFIGTPCQVAAARSVVDKMNDNFFCIDIICHGVPSVKLLQDYVKTISSDKIREISFRSSVDTSSVLSLSVLFANGSLLRRSVGYSSYFSAFLRSLSYRDSCYRCRFAQPCRTGDITLGDFWGLGKLKTSVFNPHLGVSVFLSNTDKASTLKSLISQKIFAEERTVEEALKGNPQLNQPARRNLLNPSFVYLYPRLGYKWSARLCTVKDKIHYLIFVPLVSKIYSLCRK